jgi:hypothetical protein
MTTTEGSPCYCSKSELEIFDTLPMNVSMERGDYVAFRPLATISASSPLEFTVPASHSDYVDLGRTKLLVRLKVTKPDGSALADDAKVSTTNLLLHSLFSQVDCKLNNKLITPSVLSYPYKAYLETLLAHSRESKQSWLASEMYYDDNQPIEGGDPTNGNRGLKARNKRIKQSRIVELVGRPHVDIFQQEKFLLNGVDMTLKFTRSSVGFHLMADDGVEAISTILDAVLYVRRVQINPTIVLQHEQTLGMGITAKYPVRRGVVTSFTIPTGNHSFHKESLLTGQLPRRIILGFVLNSACNGDKTLNPFNFQHFGLNYLAVHTDNQQFPSQPLKPNFADLETVDEYYRLYSGMGLTNSNHGINITLEQFMHGFTLFPLDLTPDMSEGPFSSGIKFMNLRVEGHFSRALEQPINCICYAEYDNMIQIDQNRNVVADYAPA